MFRAIQIKNSGASENTAADDNEKGSLVVDIAAGRKSELDESWSDGAETIKTAYAADKAVFEDAMEKDLPEGGGEADERSSRGATPFRNRRLPLL